jgi:preprotein translocase subunit YajC
MFDLEVLTFTLAQQPVPVTPEVGGSSGTPAGTTAPGGNGGGAAPTGPAPGGDLMLLFVVLIVAMLVFTMWSSRRDRKKREAMVNAVKKHDRVQTIGGVIGSVVEVKSDTVVLKVDESSNTRITFARSAVQQVLTSSADSPPSKSES